MSEQNVSIEYLIHRKELELNLEETDLNIKRLEHQRYLIILDIQSLDSEQVKEETPSNLETKVKRLRKTDDQPSRDDIEIQK